MLTASAPTKSHRHFFSIVLLGFIWGSAFAIARYAITQGVPPLGYAFWQTLGPAVILLCFTLFFRKKNKAPIVMTKNIWAYFLFTGLIGILIPNTNRYLITAHVPSGTLAVMINSTPLFIYPLALLTREDNFKLKKLLGFIAGIAGLFIIVFSGTSSHPYQIHRWDLIALISPFCYALCAVYIAKKRPENLASATLVMGMLFFAALFLTPIMILTHQLYVPTWSILSLAILAEIILSTIGYVLLFEILKKVGAISYSLSDSVVAITGLFWGWLFFQEPLGLLIILAVILIVLGIRLASS